MTVVVDDPLIAAMLIREELPLHESARRLRGLCPDSPRVHGVAVMRDVSRRRWWPLAEALTARRLEAMYDAAVVEIDNPVAAAHQLAATLAHGVIGRVVALVVLEGRAWDVGLENLWVHVDSEDCIDWLAVVDPTLRVLPEDVDVGRDGVVTLPGEAALATWTAHRCHRSLAPLFAELHRVCGGVVGVEAMWRSVGTAVVSAATQVPARAGFSEAVGMRRGQAVLDALAGFGLPVRGGTRLRADARVRSGRATAATSTNPRIPLAKLGQPGLG